MRTGVPSSLTKRSSGSAGQPSARPSSGWFGLTASGVLGVFAQGGIGRGNGALWRKPPGRSIVPSSVIRIASARIVWKPFECAARPRIAWNATGLPVTVSCSLPQMSVQGIGSSIFCVARGDPHLVREAADRFGRNARDAGGPLGRVVLDALLQQLERGLHRGAVGQPEFAQQVRVRAVRVRDDGPVRRPVPPQLVLRVEAAFLARHLGADEHAELVVGRVHVHELARVGVADEEIAIVETERDQLVAEREQECPIRARLDRQPVVGDRRVAGADGIDRDEAAAVPLEFRDRDLERVRVMILGGADHHEELRAFEVGPAELPERAADRVDHAGGHVDRAEAAVRRVVRRAELPREEAGQRLHLVASGEERELLRVGGADLPQPLFEQRERVVP